MSRELSRLLESVVQSVQQGLHQTSWRPAVDVYETPEGWLLKCDLAGIERKDVSVSVDDRTVTLSGCRRDHLARSGVVLRSLEISYSCFVRSVTLPERIDPNQVDVQLDNGLLLVSLKQKGA